MRNKDCSSHSQIQQELFCKWRQQMIYILLYVQMFIYLLLLEKGIRVVIIIIETLNKIIQMYWVILSFVQRPAALLGTLAPAPIGTLGDASVCWSDKVKKIQRDNTMETRIAIICCMFYRGCLMPRNTFPELSQGLGCVGAGGGLTPASS